jgi:predicted Co/Zn/Cd cation transporter (cation efflux family)
VTRDVSGQATPAAGDAETQDAAEGRRERLALRLSAVASAVIGGVAVAWGLAVQSQALLLDGVYALIGTALSLLTLHAARLVAAGPTPHYPFGREALGPLMVGVQGLVLLGTLLYASVDALLTIRSGGSQAAVGSALVYAVLSLGAGRRAAGTHATAGHHVRAGRRGGGAVEGRRGAVRACLRSASGWRSC